MIDQIREQFPFFDGYDGVYLDSAATTQKPKVVIDAITNFYKSENSNVHRGLYPLAEETSAKFDLARTQVAAAIGGKSNEIIFTKNGTEAANLFASLFCEKFIEEGDVVVITEAEHHSNIVPWQILERKYGFRIEWLPIRRDGSSVDLEYMDFLARKFRERIKIVSFTGASNVIGDVVDLSELVAKARGVGAKCLLDASQLVAHSQVRIEDLDVDALYFSAHKTYGPMGVGVGWCKAELLQEFEPWLGGGEMISTVSKNGFESADIPHKFEAGTPNVAGVIATGAVMNWMNSLDRDAIAEHESLIAKRAFEKLSSSTKLKVIGSIDSVKSLVSFYSHNVHAHDIATLVGERGVDLRAGYHCAEPLHKQLEIGPTVRLSVGMYNTIDEVDAAVAIIIDSVEKFKI